MLRSVFGTTAGISLAMPVCRVKARSLKVKCKVKTKRKQRAYLNRYKTGNLGQERQEMYLVGGEDGVGDASAEGRESPSWTPGRKGETQRVSLAAMFSVIVLCGIRNGRVV